MDITKIHAWASDFLKNPGLTDNMTIELLNLVQKAETPEQMVAFKAVCLEYIQNAEFGLAIRINILEARHSRWYKAIAEKPIPIQDLHPGPWRRWKDLEKLRITRYMINALVDLINEYNKNADGWYQMAQKSRPDWNGLVPMALFPRLKKIFNEGKYNPKTDEYIHIK